ncbi:MAG: hypothetical protein WC869_07470 [Phycisphaerae bacterium]|jgi:hypothetical protein
MAISSKGGDPPRVEDQDLVSAALAGGNVRRLKKLGFSPRERDGIVYLWPLDHRKAPPRVLRLVVVHDGRKPGIGHTRKRKARPARRKTARPNAGKNAKHNGLNAPKPPLSSRRWMAPDPSFDERQNN